MSRESPAGGRQVTRGEPAPAPSGRREAALRKAFGGSDRPPSRTEGGRKRDEGGVPRLRPSRDGDGGRKSQHFESTSMAGPTQRPQPDRNRPRNGARPTPSGMGRFSASSPGCLPRG